MAFHLTLTAAFVRTAHKFVKQHPDLDGDLDETLAMLQNDPYAVQLRLHPLHGKHRGKHAVSLTYSHRIVLVLRVTEKEIVLLDIGTHDEVYRN